ncbi:MAG TPA: hypothetical protein PKD90_00440 [Phnomibacter sp.]|nr:hypothetical protein [Phnomibacter sp.]
MQDVTASFQHLSQKLLLLLKQQDQLVKERDKLQAENESLKQSVAAEQQLAKILEEKLAILQSSNGHMDDTTKKAFEKRINQYIKDIDKVIAHLNA